MRAAGDAKRVLFVCVHNAGRSQMAETLFNLLAVERGAAVVAESAGTEPAASVHPEVVEAMRELGIDLAHRRPRLLEDAMVQRADRVITMGCGVDDPTCPAILYRIVEDWGLPDPKGQPIERVREIRDEIRARAARLVGELAE